MTHPIRFIALAGLFFAVNSVASPTFEPNLKAGDWAISSSFGLTRQSSSDPKRTRNEVRLTQASEYFLIDRFSLGLAFRWEDESDANSTVLLGPAATYYPWVRDQLAAFVAGNVRIGLNDSTVNSILGTSVGMLYFFNPSIAAGPSLFFNHYNSHQADYDRYGLDLSFSFYL